MPLTAEQVADGLAGVYGPVSVTWRATHVDHRGNPLGVGGSQNPDLTGALLWSTDQRNPGLDGAVLSCDNARDSVMECTLALLLGNVTGGLQGLHSISHIQLWEDHIIRPPGAAAETVSFSLGIFRPSFTDITYDWKRHRAIDGSVVPAQIVRMRMHDLSVHLLRGTLGDSYIIPQGTPYRDVLRDIIGTRLDMKHNFPVGGPLIPVEQSRPPTWTYSELLTDVTDGYNRRRVWPDANGTFITRERIDPMLEPIAVHYTTAAEPRMIDAGSPFTRGLTSAAFDNRRVVVIDDPSHPDFGYVQYENADPSSPISTTATGEVRMSEAITSASRPSTRMILSTETARSIAQYDLRRLAAEATTATITTFGDPRRGPHETYLLTVDGLPEVTEQRVRVLSWRRSLTPGAPMIHEVSRVTPVSLTEILNPS